MPFFATSINKYKLNKYNREYDIEHKYKGYLPFITALLLFVFVFMATFIYSVPVMIPVFIFLSLAIVVTLVDMKIRLIPNEIVIGILISGILFRFLKEGATGLINSFIAILIVLGLLLLTSAVTFLIRRTFGAGAADLKVAGIWASLKDYTSKSIIIFIFSGLIGAGLAWIFNLDIAYIILFALFFIFICYVFRRYSLKSRITRRKDEIQNQLPGVLDLLCISVTAGLGFEQALGYVTEKDKGALIEELEIARREITLGKTRKESLVDLVERCDVEELKTFVSAINQSDELGIPLKNVLIAQSSSIRLTHKQRIEEKAIKTPIKILFSIIIFIFPVIFIVILGPAIPDLMKALNGM